MNYLVFLKLGGIFNGCGNDLPDERSSLLKTFGQLGAVMVAVRHLGPALLGATVMLVRIRWECSGAISFRPGHWRVPANALPSLPERRTCLRSKPRALPAGPSWWSLSVCLLQHSGRGAGGRLWKSCGQDPGLQARRGCVTSASDAEPLT